MYYHRKVSNLLDWVFFSDIHIEIWQVFGNSVAMEPTKFERIGWL